MTAATPPHIYAIALGSNRRHGRHGAPYRVIAAALDDLVGGGFGIIAVSPIIHTPALGPAGRGFANAAAVISTYDDPDALLTRLKAIERLFGRRPGRRWGPRVIDLDIILWSGGIFASANLSIPHPAFRERTFVLEPLVRLVPSWRDPVTGFSVAQLYARLRRRG